MKGREEPRFRKSKDSHSFGVRAAAVGGLDLSRTHSHSGLANPKRCAAWFFLSFIFLGETINECINLSWLSTSGSTGGSQEVNCLSEKATGTRSLCTPATHSKEELCAK